MSDYLTSQMVHYQIKERLQTAERARMAGRRRRSRRHALAGGRHRLADRIDT
jgi:hypothetical protein